MTTPVAQERRRARRYPIVAPVSWTGGEGFTENVSTAGAYFVTPSALAVGQQVELTLTLPRQAVPVKGQGTVVRIDSKLEGGFGIGVRFERIEPLPIDKP